MFKKITTILLLIFVVFSFSSLTSCGKENNGNETSKGEKVAYKIGIMTGTVTQNEEEYRAAERVKAKYGDMIIHQTSPDDFMKEQEVTISNVLSMASDPKVKAIIICQAIPGTSAAIDKAREVRDDILFIVGVPGEDPDMIASKADIVLQADELGMGTAIIEQAKKQGAKTFVHYSFPRHMSYQLLSMRRDIFKDKCKELGIEFVDATAPDPTGDAGVPGAQQFILEDVPRKVAEYGKDTAFFSTNCSMQEPLIKSSLIEGAIYPQPCCPSPYHGFPGALGIAIPEDKQGDIPYAVEQIKSKVAEYDGTGRFSTWPVPINMMFIEAGAEYAIAYLEGKTDGKNDSEKLTELFKDYADNELTMTTYTNSEGNELDNMYLILLDYLTF
ncbi:DUF3798 domain-containing protein [Oceanirhabdus sp. W0125-5]|uniref:DUF3798 domain-containing protein n=1 Tax=Oceanirhabdus sp. W0125-5 TaxID=2999116 RepID=UPI0022F2FE9B|nr:DUF3798 domain-containing protein [Oceanirhabdus sp. W0125-5]WBW98429.1 DUF3798 domain-containing protein [Oceanirhabdus sp. W0125-5]